MESNDKRYELIINSSINMLKVFTIITMLVLVIIGMINSFYDISKIWNISFLIPMFLIYFASVIELVICFWRVGIVKNIENSCKRKSRLIFSSCITYIVFLGTFIMYSILSIILFS